MKSISKFLTLAATVSVLATSCSKEEEDPFASLDFAVQNAVVDEQATIQASNTGLGDYMYVVELASAEISDTLVGATVNYTFVTEGTYDITMFVDEVERKQKAVEVGFIPYQSSKKLYASVIGKNIFEIDLSATDKQAVDTEILAGSNAMTIKWANRKLFIFDAGIRLGWSGASDYDGDEGFIKTWDPARESETTLINFTPRAYDDAYFGYVEGANVYWADRNFDVTKISVSSRDLQFTYDDEQDAAQGQYNSADFPSEWSGLDYGTLAGAESYAYNGGFQRVESGEWYAALTSHGSGGIYKIAADYSTIEKILADYYVGDLQVVGNKIYFVSLALNGLNEAGIYVCNIDGSDVTLIDGTIRKDLSGSGVWAHSSIAVDEEGGKVYWTHRADTVLNPDDKSGIKSCNLDGSGIELVAEIEDAIGLAFAPAYE